MSPMSLPLPSFMGTPCPLIVPCPLPLPYLPLPPFPCFLSPSLVPCAFHPLPYSPHEPLLPNPLPLAPFLFYNYSLNSTFPCTPCPLLVPSPFPSFPYPSHVPLVPCPLYVPFHSFSHPFFPWHTSLFPYDTITSHACTPCPHLIHCPMPLPHPSPTHKYIHIP